MYRDYGDKVDFYYVYKTVEHPGINGFVEPFSIEERLKHIGIAKERLNTEITWLCDSMDNDVKHFFGRSPNGEFVIGPDGKIVRKRFWSDADTLRSDLEELVGKSESFTKPQDVETGFKVETVPNDKIASGVFPEIELPKGLKPLQIVPQESDLPFYAKLRVEATPKISKGGGQLYFFLSLDPIHEFHWNNLAGKVRIELSDTDGMRFSSERLESDAVEEAADIDPRRFLVDLKAISKGKTASFTAKVFYHVCDDAETICLEAEQEYQILLDYNRDGGTRPGIFMIEMFQDIPGWDANEDGIITMDELPKRHGKLVMNHIDYSANGTIEMDEVERFKMMFNNGTTIGSPDGSAKKPESSKPDAGESSEDSEPAKDE